MYELNSMFGLITDEKYRGFIKGGLSLPLHKVGKIPSNSLEFTYDQNSGDLTANLSGVIRDQGGVTKEGVVAYYLSERMHQHNNCCGSVFLSGLQRYHAMNWQDKDGNFITIEIPTIEERLKVYIEMMRYAGYSTIQYIVTDRQKDVREALDSVGFKLTHSVENKRTNAILNFMQFDL
jgi:hypothetical protein